jgi:hypothetical protein
MGRLSEKQIHELADRSAHYYLAEGYHVVEHRDEVREERRKLGELAAKYGIQHDPQVGEGGSLFHDAGLAIAPSEFLISSDHGVKYATCDEDVAMTLFRGVASEMELPQDYIEDVVEAIAGTNPGNPLRHIEAKLLAAADIRGVGLGDYATFVSNTHKLHHEAQWKNARQIRWEDFVAGSIGYLGLFTARNIHVTPEYFDEDDRSVWHIGAVKNILKLTSDTWTNVFVEGEVIEDVTVAGVPDKTVRSIKLTITGDTPISGAEQNGPKVMTLGVPMENDSLSLPGHSLNRLHMDPNTFLKGDRTKTEVGRVLKPEGLFIAIEKPRKVA